MCVTLSTSVLADTEVIDVTPQQVEELLDSKEVPIVIDARTPEEYAEGHIKGAIVIDVTAKDFKEKLGKMDKSKVYIVHCLSGARGRKAVKVFEKLGFKKVYHMNGGMMAWEDSGNPVDKGE
ncbi:rhodanese-like domain-containing protein [Rubritalea sp.]|uniref:rhodanese-like domain-containing protein n=1 Tax=Rubritalea sp. TaxID=2109375 RepID=UPI003EF5CB8A